MTFGSLFSGIGGMDLGLCRAGMEPRWFVEIDEFCRKVLEKHWPHVKRYGDIRTIRGDELEPVDLICGGFPCQPFSTAGLRRGAADDRYLWPEMFRIVKEHKPAWVLGENVAGISSMVLKYLPAQVESRTVARNPAFDIYRATLSRQEIMLLESVCQDLESEGYEVQPLVIPACALNAPHERCRVWILAYSSGERNGRLSIRSGRSLEAATDIERCCQDVAYSNGRGCGQAGERGMGATLGSGRDTSDMSPEAEDKSVVADADAIGRHRWPGIFGKEWRGELADGSWWAAEPDVGRVASRLPTWLDGGVNLAHKSCIEKARTAGIPHTSEVRALWEHREYSEASQQPSRCLICGLPLSEVPCEGRDGPWYVGAWTETRQGMPYMRQDVYRVYAQSCEDVQQGMSVGTWTPQCEQTMANRVDRLRALGNAVVPQVAEFIGRRIMEAAREAAV